MIKKQRALFLDRDGVINVDYGYVHHFEQFDFMDDIFELCKKANERNYLIIIVTNQAGIGRGYYTEQDYFTLTDWMLKKFKTEGIIITDVYHCPYHPNGIGKYKKESLDRKPNPGMLLNAKNKYKLDMTSSIMIGDKQTDMEAAYNAGVGYRYHYTTNSYTYKKSSSANHEISSLLEVITSFK